MVALGQMSSREKANEQDAERRRRVEQALDCFAGLGKIVGETNLMPEVSCPATHVIISHVIKCLDK